MSEVAPCDGCHRIKDCAKHRLACADFLSFVSIGVWKESDERDPTWEQYDDIFQSVKNVAARGDKHPGGRLF